MPTTDTQSRVLPPLNLKKWVEEHRKELQPPVGNAYLYDGEDFFVMVIHGPNARNDFHVVNSEEYFHQIKGDVKVLIREDDRIKEFLIREGETFFIPRMVPHCPVRPPDTIGIVVERRRPPGETEHLVFYCPNCSELVYDMEFDCKDIVIHFRQAMEDFWNDDELRVCKNCGTKIEKPGPVKPFK